MTEEGLRFNQILHEICSSTKTLMRSLQLVCRRANGVLAAICRRVFSFFSTSLLDAARVSFNVKLNRDMMSVTSVGGTVPQMWNLWVICHGERSLTCFRL